MTALELVLTNDLTAFLMDASNKDFLSSAFIF
jgi:hypothetical protein